MMFKQILYLYFYYSEIGGSPASICDALLPFGTPVKIISSNKPDTLKIKKKKNQF